MTASYKYDIFGALRSSSGSVWTEYRFNGQQDDAALGYTYLRARYYDPATGRFVSKDPFPGLLTNPASQHYYGYAGNNPANWTDPTGLVTVGICFSVTLGWGAYETRTVCPVVWTSSGEVGQTLTQGSGILTTPSASVTVGVQVSNGNRLSDLEGPYGTAGGSVRYGPLTGGGDAFWGRNECSDLIYGGSGQLGIGTPGGEIHAGVTQTQTKPYTFD